MADQVTELRQRIHREGYDTRKTGDGHWEVIDPEGQIVRYKGGTPLRFPGTPSDRRGMKNAVAQLRDAGVLPRPAEVKHRNNGRDKTKLGRDQLKVYSDALRAEIKSVMIHGSYKQSDIYHFADRWASEHKLPVPSHPAGVFSKFLKGASLTNVNYTWLTSALSAIKRNEGKIPEGRESEPTDLPKREHVEKAIEVVGESAPRKTKLPQLAMDTMQMIYKDEKDHDAIMALVQEIAKLELQ